MVNILSPKSIYVDNNDASTYTLTWEGSIEGQTDYEIMYKEKGSESWFTTGKVTSTNTSYDLRNIHTILDIDFSEIQYKVKLYYSKAGDDGNGNTQNTTGTEESNVYSLIFNQGISGNLNVWTGSEKRSYPVFNEIKNANLKKINFATSEGFKSAPLVDEDSILSSNLKIRVRDDETRCVASNNPKFTYYTPSESDVFGNFYVYGRTTYAYDERYKYRYINYTYTYYGYTSSSSSKQYTDERTTYTKWHEAAYYYYYLSRSDPVYAYKHQGSTPGYWAVAGYGGSWGSTTYYYWRTDPVSVSYITYYTNRYAKGYRGAYYYYTISVTTSIGTTYYYYYYRYYDYANVYRYSYKYRTVNSSTNYSYEYTS